MNKLSLMLVLGLSCLFLVACGKKATPPSAIDTWILFTWEQVLTWIQSGDLFADTNNNLREELTGDVSVPSWSLTGQQHITGQVIATGYVADISGKTTPTTIADFKNQLKPVSKTSSALTEDDIDNMYMAIEFIKNLFQD